MITLEQVTEAIAEGIDRAHDMGVTHQDYAESAARLVMELIAAEVARLTAERDAARRALADIDGLITFEINPSNYDHDQVCEMNNIMCEVVGIARDYAAKVSVPATLVEAMQWYEEQARKSRLIHSEGDTGRRNLQADGGEKARAALRAIAEAPQ